MCHVLPLELLFDKHIFKQAKLIPCSGRYYCAKDIAARGGHVIVAARNMERCEKAVAKIKVRRTLWHGLDRLHAPLAASHLLQDVTLLVIGLNQRN